MFAEVGTGLGISRFGADCATSEEKGIRNNLHIRSSSNKSCLPTVLPSSWRKGASLMALNLVSSSSGADKGLVKGSNSLGECASSGGSGFLYRKSGFSRTKTDHFSNQFSTGVFSKRFELRPNHFSTTFCTRKN